MSFYAARILFGMIFSETGASFVKHCHDSALATPAKLPYTGIDAVDHRMCVLVTFMNAALDDGRAYFFHEFYASFGPSAVIPFLEMRRVGYRLPVVFASMVFLGVLYQLFSGAVILPLWWTVHLLSSGLSAAPLHPHYVEGAFIAYLLGYLLVSVALVVYRSVAIGVAWQVFPASIVLIQILYLGYQHYANGDVPDCSHDLLQLVHITNFCWSAITHAFTLFRVFRSPAPFESLGHAYYPTFSPSSLGPMSSLAQSFLKWDILFISSTTLFAGLWLLRGTRPRILAIGWFVLGSLCFGMGAALSGIWMWREKVLEEDRRVRVQKPKEE